MIIKPNFKNNFTQVSNEIINHKSLSNTAKLLCIKILSLPSSWKVNSKYLGQFLGISARSANRYLKELIDEGIFEKVQEISEKDKKFTPNFTLIFKSNDENENEQNEPLESLENREIKNQTPKNDGFVKSEVEQRAEKSKCKTGDKITPSGIMSHIYNKEFISNNKFLYKFADKNIFMIFTGAKVRKNELDLSAFDEKEAEKIEQWFKYKGKMKNKKLSFESKELQLKKLRDFKLGEQNIISIINRSIENGWQGLFAFQGDKNSKGKNSKASVAQEEKNALMAYFDTLNEGKQCLV